MFITYKSSKIQYSDECHYEFSRSWLAESKQKGYAFSLNIPNISIQ